MADWIKVEKATPTKPRVLALADLLNVTPDDALGKCVRLWMWFDSNTSDGNAPRVTRPLLDRALSAPGLCCALEKLGWIRFTKRAAIMPGFLRHNGDSAKNRLLAAERSQRFRDAHSVAKPSPDKKRLDKNNRTPPNPPCKQGGSSGPRLTRAQRTRAAEDAEIARLHEKDQREGLA